ncbi:His/Gly/Thr/Pro-type tRNA ligase C-terminal domain-containing protein [Paraburkholderia atlantica]|uniref:His/Gly/Thr/Pro-type tRNA ligase C-terminal domain-containing protein n=1 Tax=Paraburkholderia atlantica TaxID=2654982 RepID=UPI001616942D|nr:His/Gly/Thr/Pro-type tRNA ligase C-terminal domain-containing protein [Paraburkholderia atlantica]
MITVLFRWKNRARTSCLSCSRDCIRRPRHSRQKIVDAREKRVPFLVVVGKREAADRTVSVRWSRDGAQREFGLAEGVTYLKGKGALPGSPTRG